MTPTQTAYRAGEIVAEIDARFGLTPAALNNAAVMPDKLPTVLRHVWRKAAAVPEVAALLDGFDPPAEPCPPAAQALFWLGYYHQRAARELPADLGPRLKALRDKAGLSGAELAEKAGTTRQTVHNLEAGTYRPTWDLVQALAAALGVPTDTFRDK